MNLKPIFKGLWGWTKRNSTKILAGGAIIAEALGFYFMHKEAPVVHERLKELPPDAKWYEKIKVAGPVYLPAIGMMALSMGCIIGGCAAGEKKAAIMAGLYSASEASLRRLEQKVVKEIGPEKAKELHDAAVEDLAKQNPPKKEYTIETGFGNKLFFERMTGQWFRSSYEAVKNAQADFNLALADDKREIVLDFNDWLDYLAGPSGGPEHAKFGEYFCFHRESPLLLVISDDHKYEDGEQYYIVDYSQSPGYGPVLYNGKPPRKAFNSYDDCFPYGV